MFNKFIDDLQTKIPAIFKDGDFYENGFMYCGKCRSRKECRIEIFGQERIVPCICDCIIKQEKQAEDDYIKAKLKKNIIRYKKQAFENSIMQEWNFDNDDNKNSEISNYMKNYAENFKLFKKHGKGLLIYGSVGIGKSYYAACIANSIIETGQQALMTNFTNIINKMQGMYEGKYEYIDELSRYPLLIIDDLGVERGTEYVQEQVYTIIDSRYRMGLPLIITTNLSIEDIKKPINICQKRIYDRILENCLPVEIKGKSKRKAKSIINFYEMTEILKGKK